MKRHPDNPSSNELKTPLSEAVVLAAVRQSGYPLQIIISRYLRDNLGDTYLVNEEWGYKDYESSEARTLDIHAEKYLYDPGDNKSRRIRPILSLLIECKQSELPYVFFLSEGTSWLPYFPMFCGLFGDAVSVKEFKTKLGKVISTPVTTSIANGLELDDHAFIKSPPAFSLTLSKCVRKGKDIVLSGSDSYMSLVLPLLKAAKHLHEIEKPPETRRFFDCRLTLCVGVLDAPMIGVRIESGSEELTLLPWVRVLRHQSEKRAFWENIAAIDVVHKDFFDTYLKSHVFPFAEKFAEKTSEHEGLLVKASD